MSTIAYRSIAFIAAIVLLPIAAGETDPEFERLKAEVLRLRATEDAGRIPLDTIREPLLTIKDRWKMKALELDGRVEELKQIYKPGAPELNAVEQARDAVIRRLAQAEVVFPPAPQADDVPRAVEKKPAQNNPNSSRLRVKLPSGAELEAEGPWLQNIPDTTREILDQFADPVKDGAVGLRLPDAFDPEGVMQLRKIMANIAPAVTVDYLERQRFLIASSEDLAQLRRIASVFRAVKQNFGPNNFGPFDGRGFFDPNQKKFTPPGNDFQGFKDQQLKFPGGTPTPKGKGDPENMKKFKDPINDQF